MDDYSDFALVKPKQANDYSGFTPVKSSQFDNVEGGSSSLDAPTSKPPQVLINALMGIGDVMRGSKNAANAALRGITGGRLGDKEQVVAEGKQLGDYAGEVGTDVAMSALPIGMVNKAVKGATMLPRAVRSVIAPVADVAANAGYAAATNEDNREAAALGGGLGAAGGRVLTGAIGKLGRPTKTNDITQLMLDEGIPLTPGQAGGWLSKALEGSLYNTPFMPGIRRAVGKAQKAGMEASEDFLIDAGKITADPAAYGLTEAEAKAWIKGAQNVNDVSTSTVPLAAIAAVLHIKTGGATFAALSALYGTETGRKFLLGQLPMQEALQKAPMLAPHIAQVTRAMSTPEAQRE